MKRNHLPKLAQEIEEHLRATRQILRQPLETRITREGLTGPQLSIIRALLETDRLTLSELSKKVGLNHSTVSGIVDRLSSRHIVERVAHESDARFTRIAITKQVRAFMREKLPSVALDPLVNALKHARAADRAKVLAGLKTLRSLLERDARTKFRTSAPGKE